MIPEGRKGGDQEIEEDNKTKGPLESLVERSGPTLIGVESLEI